MLERPPRGARLRAAGGVPATAAGTRSSSARRASVPRRPRSCPGRPRTARRRPRRVPVADLVPSLASVADALPRGARARRGARPRIRRPCRTTSAAPYTSARFRTDRRLDRAAVARAHDVLYLSDAWTEATLARRAGAEEPARPVGLPGDHLRDATRSSSSRPGTYRGGSAFYPRLALRSLGAGEVVSIDIEPVRDDYPVHPRVTYLGGRSSTDPDVVERGARACGPVGRSSSSSTRITRRRTSRPSSPTYAPLVPVGVLRDRRGLEHRSDPQGPAARAARGDRDVPRDRPTSSRSTATREKFLITFNPSGYLRRVGRARNDGAGARRAQSRVRRPRSTPHRRRDRAVDPPEHELRVRPRRDPLAVELDARLREDVLGRRARRPRESEQRAAGADVDALDRQPVRRRVADVGGAVDRRVEGLGEEQRVALRARSRSAVSM